VKRTKRNFSRRIKEADIKHTYWGMKERVRMGLHIAGHYNVRWDGKDEKR